MSEALLREKALAAFDDLAPEVQDWLACYSTRPILHAADFRVALAGGRIDPAAVLHNIEPAKAGLAADVVLGHAVSAVIEVRVAKKPKKAVLAVVRGGDR